MNKLSLPGLSSFTQLVAVSAALLGVAGCAADASEVQAPAPENAQVDRTYTAVAATEEARIKFGIVEWQVYEFVQAESHLRGVDADGRVVIDVLVSARESTARPSMRIVGGDPRVIAAVRAESLGDGETLGFINGLTRTILALVRPIQLEMASPSMLQNFPLAKSFDMNDRGLPRSPEVLRRTMFCQVRLAEETYKAAKDTEDVCEMKFQGAFSNEAGRTWRGESETSITLAFGIKGTDSMDDAMLDIKSGTHASTVERSTMSGFPSIALPGDIYVGQGWTQRWSQVSPNFRGAFARAQAEATERRKELQVLFVGHSLGAATAQVAAVALHEEMRAFKVPFAFHVRATTFNSPTVGNKAFRKLVQERLAEGCPKKFVPDQAGMGCLSMHLFERESDMVHDVPFDDVHPVWQTDNRDATMGAGPLSGRVGGDKTMYYGSSMLIGLSTAAPDCVASHLLKFWRHDVAIMTQEQLQSMHNL